VHYPLETEFYPFVQNPSAKYICMSIWTARWLRLTTIQKLFGGPEWSGDSKR
jgi:hypothetical protein